jgi:hypothetical protein
LLAKQQELCLAHQTPLGGQLQMVERKLPASALGLGSHCPREAIRSVAKA